MFLRRKKDKEIVKKMTFDIDEDERSLKAVSQNLSSEDVFWHLKRNYEYYGNLLITDVQDDFIEVTSIGTIENNESNKRLEDLQEVINTHVKGRAVPGTKGYLVISEGEVVKMFSNDVMARFEKMRIERTGVNEYDIKIQEIYIE